MCDMRNCNSLGRTETQGKLAAESMANVRPLQRREAETRGLSAAADAREWLSDITDRAIKHNDRAVIEIYRGELVYPAAIASQHSHVPDKRLAHARQQADQPTTPTGTLPRGSGSKHRWEHLDKKLILKALDEAHQLHEPGPSARKTGCYVCGVNKSSEWRESGNVVGIIVCGECWPLLDDAVADGDYSATKSATGYANALPRPPSVSTHTSPT